MPPSPRLGACALVPLLAVAAWAAFASAGAQAQTDYRLTLVARECPTYPSIMANRARNNIQESLEDLGADSVYAAGQPIDPAIEAANNGCVPMTVPWTFTLGRNIAGQDVGIWGALSRVGGVFRSVSTTLAGVPVRDSTGNVVLGTIPSAVTIDLTQAELAQTASRLWVQGGTPGSPLNGQQATYGFGALRCAIDNLNGDNVEWIGYPAGSRHVYCYAYYVKPPPTSGTIRVVKRNFGDTRVDFVFRGNISFAPDPQDPGNPASNFFALSPPAGGSASDDFFRAGGVTWNLREDLPAGWRLDAASCASAGASVVAVNGPGDFSIALAAGDLVTCTFDNSIEPPTAGLLLVKSSGDGDPDNGLEAVGTFALSITGPGVNLAGDVTTIVEDEPVAGLAAPALVAGTVYTIAETWPANDPLGTWGLDPVAPAFCTTCSGGTCTPVAVTPVATATGASFQLTMPATPTVCGFNNRLTYSAQLLVGKNALDAPGTFTFHTARLDDPTFEFDTTIDANTPGVPVYAPTTGGLPWGTYRIVETSGNPGLWRLASVACYDTPVVPVGQPEPVPFATFSLPPLGFIDVELTPQRPFARCVFVNERIVAPLPGNPAPVPGPGVLGLLAIAFLLAWTGAGATRRRRR